MLLPALALLAASTLLVSADDDPLQLKISSGDVPRAYSPVRALVTREALKGLDLASGLLSLKSDAGERIAQVIDDGEGASVELVWVEQDLAADTARVYSVQPLEEKPETRFRFAEGPGYRSLLYGDAPIYRHEIRYDPGAREETKKTYHHIFGMNGEGFITKGAGGLHPHHRGVFAGWLATVGDRGTNFWVCNGGASIRHREYPQDEQVGVVLARDVSLEDWVDGDGTTLVRERRVTETWQPLEGQRLFDITLILEAAAEEPVRLSGDPHHGGLQVRAAQQVAESGGSARYLRPESAEGGHNDIWESCPWAVMEFEVRGHRYAIQHMDHPENPRPMVYSTRPYGRFGSFFVATLEPGVALALRYRLLLIDRGVHPEMGRGDFEARYRDYVSRARGGTGRHGGRQSEPRGGTGRHGGRQSEARGEAE